MTDEKETYVLVRLPLTGEQIAALSKAAAEIAENDFRFARHHYAACVDLVRAIGTPVEASGLEVVARELSPLVPVEIVSPTVGTTRVEMMTIGKGAPLVRQSDAEAKIAALKAENARIREAANRRKVKCTGCGSAWTDLDLYDARLRDGLLLSCCPERDPVPLKHFENLSRVASLTEQVARLTAERDRIVQETRRACAELCQSEMDGHRTHGNPEAAFGAKNCRDAIRNAGEKA